MRGLAQPAITRTSSPGQAWQASEEAPFSPQRPRSTPSVEPAVSAHYLPRAQVPGSVYSPVEMRSSRTGVASGERVPLKRHRLESRHRKANSDAEKGFFDAYRPPRAAANLTRVFGRGRASHEVPPVVPRLPRGKRAAGRRVSGPERGEAEGLAECRGLLDRTPGTAH
jgi:hypothetical protein